ncbi:hypothetical protein [Pseudoflavitalea rhizosphaerae]|uniref:hypothetical protein n=1 Tax=Pseudoflavitalea rhizosphaerae TaxID=1884793 RepID=UPI000F8D8770|nr:hypothetical protein [Pseudoflavitalea rhizosphaerae]
MKQTMILLAIATIILSGCQPTSPYGKITLRGFSFNDNGLSVITYQINDKAGTMSILYNDTPQQQFKLVTYRQQENKFWYGSKINGDLLQVETVDSNGAYHSEPNNIVDTTARIKYILEQQPAAFPQ